MSGPLKDVVKRWTAKRKSALVIEIIQGKTTVAEASRSFDLSPSEIEGWVSVARMISTDHRNKLLLEKRVQSVRAPAIGSRSFYGSFCFSHMRPSTSSSERRSWDLADTRR